MPSLCIIPGDGIGQEVIPPAVEVLTTVIPNLEIVPAEGGWNCFTRTGSSMPESTLATVKRCKAALFGAVSSPSYKVKGYHSAILTLRQELDLFANIRPVRSLPHLSPVSDVDLIIVRENTEGLYSGREYSVGYTNEDMYHAIAERVISRRASRRIARRALDLAYLLGRRRLTIVHKANILPVTDGLFRDCVREVAQEFACENLIDPGWVKLDEMLVDTASYRLVSSPQAFDMIVTTNLFGDILSDIASHWVGGLGYAASLNWGDDVAVAEPVHGSAPDIAGKGIANPIAAILSGALLVRYAWNLPELASRIEFAVSNAINEGMRMDDDKPSATTSTATITKAVLRWL